MEYNAILWLVFMVVLIVIEIMTMGLYTIWFAGGALIAFFATLLGFDFWTQMWTFAIVSAALLIFTRPVLQEKFNGKLIKTNLDTIIGKQIVLTEKVDNRQETGKTHWNGLDWVVRSADDEVTFDEGAVVTVTAIQGVKLIIK